jgi:hypothetical protein
LPRPKTSAPAIDAATIDAPRARPPAPDGEAGERAGEDDDVDEEGAGERERHLRAGVGATVRDADRQVDQHDRGQGLPFRHNSKTTEPSQL